MSTNGLFTKAFERRYDQLKEKLDIKSGLLTKLFDAKILTSQNLREINHVLKTDAQQVECLLIVLEKRPDEDFETFCRLLKSNNQEHIIRDCLNQVNSEQAALFPSPCLETRFASTVDGSAAASAAVISRSTELLDEPDFVDLPPERIKVTLTTRDFYDKQHAAAYPMNKSYRGVACIINVFKTKNFRDRDGTDADRVRLEALFKQLQFNVISYEDDHGLDAHEILKKIKLTANKTVDTNPPQCYVLFILSHGEMNPETNEEFVLGTDGEQLSKDDILKSLADEDNLTERPCLVFFVCCRRYDTKIRHDAVEVDPDRHFLVAFPCKEASVSWRNKTEGTYYVRCLVKVFTEFAHNTDVETMIEKVKHELLRLKSTQHADAPVSSLKKKLYFFPGITL